MTTRLGINGFGRIGRNFLRALVERDADIEVVGVNDLTDSTTLAHLLRYDSVHGRFAGNVEASDDGIVVNGREIAVTAERNPADLRWKDLGADVVVESTGRFTDARVAAGHLEAGARKVIISAPAKNEDVTVIPGVTDDQYDPAEHDVVSIGSCTTNSVVPLAKILDDNFDGIQRGFLTTVHAYTNDQGTHDQPHKDLRRSRAAAVSIIPTTTGAAKAVRLALPQLDGRLDGMALRVPVPDGSITDLVAVVGQETSVEDVNAAFRAAAEGPMRGVVAYTEDPIVSADIVGDPHSCIFDSLSTLVSEPPSGDTGSMVKVLGWYDNEWGFSCRLVDMALVVGERL